MSYRYHTGTWDGESIFVFGSNLLGKHAGGAAKFAVDNCGALEGVGQGLFGKSYALPTCYGPGNAVPFFMLVAAAVLFTEFANVRHDLGFFVTPVGTGIAGFPHEQIAPLFKYVPENVMLPPEWKDILER